MRTEGKYSSILIARYMMAYANDNGIDMSITKLNKLLYALYGVYLAVMDERLTDEHPHAWPYGPVFPRVREDFIDHEKEYWCGTLSDVTFDEVRKDDKFNACLKSTMDYFGKYNATSLIEWTHKRKSPWTKTTKDEFFAWNDVISDENIQNYFKRFCSWK